MFFIILRILFGKSMQTELKNSIQDFKNVSFITNDTVDGKDGTPLHCVYNKRNDVIKLSLKAKPDVTMCNQRGQTILHLYCSRNNGAKRDIIELIIETFINIHQNADNVENEILDVGQQEKDHLISKISDFVWKEDEDNKTAYDYALEKENYWLLSILFKYKVQNIEFSANDGGITRAIFNVIDQKHHLDSIEGLKFNEDHLYQHLTSSGQTLLHFAVLFGNFEMIEYLIDKVDDVRKLEDTEGFNLLHYVCRRDPTNEMLEKILSKWPDISNESCGDGNTPLIHSMQIGAYETVKLLLEEKYNIDVNHKNKADKNILHFLAKQRVHHIPKEHQNQLEKIVNVVLHLQSFKFENCKNVLRMLVDRNDIIMILQIARRLYDGDLTIKHFFKDANIEHGRRFYALLDEKQRNSPEGWQKLLSKLSKESRKKKKNKSMANFSMNRFEEKALQEECFYKVGKTIVEIMKTRRITIRKLYDVAIKEGRKDIQGALDRLTSKKNCSFNTILDYTDLEELRTCLGDCSSKKDAFKEICERLKFTNDEIREIKEICKHQRECYAPTEELMDTIHKRAPDFSLLGLFNALRSKEVSQMLAAKELIDTIKDMILDKLDELDALD